MSALVGLSMDASADFRAHPGGKNALLFEALDRRYGLGPVLRPALPRGQRLLLQARAAHPDRGTWRRRFNLDPRTFEARTQVARRLLGEHARPGQLLVQLHTLMGSGGVLPYVLHTDTNYALTERVYPQGAPLRGGARQRFLELEGAVYRGAEALFPRSAWLARSLVEDYGCAPGRVVVVGAGNNLPVADLASKRWDGQTALFVGLEWERKGGPVLLRAWERVVAELPQARLRVVGVPRPPAVLPGGVEWLGVVRDRDRLRQLYASSTVFVMPSVYEPWGHVFLEAMASGLPCVGTEVCAMPEIVGPGRTGLLVPPSDPSSLALALLELLQDPDRAEALGRAGQDRLAQGWTWDAVVERMAPALDRALGR
jgi:starch synthase